MDLNEKKHQNILKKLVKIILTTVLSITLFGCDKDDSPNIGIDELLEDQSVFGKWSLNEKIFSYENAKYIIINDDYSINILSENELGFRSIHSGYEVLPENIISNTLRLVSEVVYQYTLEGNKLSIVNQEDGSEVTLARDRNGPSSNSWVKTLTILDLEDAPWNRNVDIAYNGSKILFPNGIEDQTIGIVNSGTLNLEGLLTTDINSYSIEVEKTDSPNKLHFQSETGSIAISAYEIALNATEHLFNSIDLGTKDESELAILERKSTIRGVASMGNGTIWVSNAYSRELFMYDYEGAGEILKSIPLDLVPYGLDFQNGYLYVSDGKLLHKCQTSPNFKAVESYKIPGYDIFGIAYDGSNFVLNTQKLPEDDNAIILVGLETDNKLLRVDLSI